MYTVLERKSGEERKILELEGKEFHAALVAMEIYGELLEKDIEMGDIPQIANILTSMANMTSL